MLAGECCSAGIGITSANVGVTGSPRPMATLSVVLIVLLEVLRFADAQNFVLLARIQRRAGNEQMNIEQGISKEETRAVGRDSHKKREKP
jgi:hypothetical protein